MRIAIFTLPDSAKDKNIHLNGKYQFANSEFKTSEQDGELIKSILCEYYGCKLTYQEPTATEPVQGAGGDLTASNTKPGEATKTTESAKSADTAKPAEAAKTTDAAK